jgi:hypothetical protein
MPVEELPPATWLSTFFLGFVSAVFDNIPLTKLCLEQGHAIRHLDEEARYCELWTNDGGYIPDHRFATARSRIIANRPELWPVDKETENG